MVDFYLKTKENKNLFKASLFLIPTDGEDNEIIDLYPIINIFNYSNFLLGNIIKKRKIISDFDNLNELKGWLWERFFDKTKNDATQLDEVIKKLKIILTKIAKDYDLNLVVITNS